MNRDPTADSPEQTLLSSQPVNTAVIVVLVVLFIALLLGNIRLTRRARAGATPKGPLLAVRVAAAVVGIVLILFIGLPHGHPLLHV